MPHCHPVLSLNRGLSRHLAPDMLKLAHGVHNLLWSNVPSFSVCHHQILVSRSFESVLRLSIRVRSLVNRARLPDVGCATHSAAIFVACRAAIEFVLSRDLIFHCRILANQFSGLAHIPHPFANRRYLYPCHTPCNIHRFTRPSLQRAKCNPVPSLNFIYLYAPYSNRTHPLYKWKPHGVRTPPITIRIANSS